MSKKKNNKLVQVNSMYSKNGDYTAWANGQILRYDKNAVWSLGQEQNYTQILRQGAPDMTPLKNMLKKIL